MANCPKCNAHLRIIDWKQHCPHCGANLVVYDLQERLMQDADKAEVQYYHFQKKVDRVKASFVGSKLAIARIITSILPIGALFLPLAKVTAGAPFEEFSGSMTALTLYDSVDKLTGAFPSLLSGSLKTPSLYLLISLGALVLSAVMILLHFILNTLSCSKHGKARNITIDILLLVLTLASVVSFALMPSGGAVEGSLGIGAYLYVLLQLVNVGVDFAVVKQGIPVNHKPCFVGGIPIEEYFEMLEQNMPKEQIREEQYRRMQAAYDEQEKARLKAEKEKELKKQAEINGEGKADE